MIKKNMNKADRSIRIVIGVMLLYFGFVETGWVANAIIPMLLGIIGVANIVFASSGFCPLYVLAGLNFYEQDTEV